MNPNPAQNYLKAKVFTATPEQLQLMLYDGAIRFGEQAKVALQKKNYGQSHKKLTRMQEITTQMNCSLRPDVYPELCGKLSALYNYVFRKLVEADVKHNIESLDEGMALLRFQRETWVMMLNQLDRQKAAAAERIDIPDPNPRMEANFSVRG